MTVKDIDQGFSRIIKQMADLDGEMALVGVFGGEYNADGVEIAEYAIDNELGTEKIPSRPFMRLSFDNGQSALNGHISKLLKDMMERKGGPRGLVKSVGQFHEDQIRNTITKVQIPPPLHPITIKKKGNDKTLVDSGALAKSIKYKIVSTK